jgi:hypothetical protein
MSSITINGNTYSGNNIVVTNGKVFVNGKDVTPDSKHITITVEGNVDEIKVDVCSGVSILGNVKNINTTSGDVIVTGEVSGSVETTSGDVEIGGNVTGNVETTSGDVECQNISGSVSTVSGDIKHRR